MTSGTFDNLVRPVVTVTLTAASIALAVMWTLGLTHAEQAFAALSPFTSMCLIFWFRSREEQRTTEVTAAAVAAAITPPPAP